MLSHPACYATNALGFLASAGKRCVLIRRVSEVTGVPSPYLAKLMNVLAHKGIVLTQRGIGGGVCLARNPECISLYDICDALDDPCIAERCLLSGRDCTAERSCPAHCLWRDLRDQFIAFLKQTTVRDVAAFEESGRGEWYRDHRRRPDGWFLPDCTGPDPCRERGETPEEEEALTEQTSRKPPCEARPPGSFPF